MSRPSLHALGEASFARCDRISAELLALTYGTFVRQLLLDHESTELVNEQLDKIGKEMGTRLVDDFLCKSKIAHCSNLTDTADAIAKVGFRMYLGVSADVANWSQDGHTFSLVFRENPLAEFAELPDECSGLWYSNLICGVIRGALEAVFMKVDCTFVKCKLRGDGVNEIRVQLLEIQTDRVSLCSSVILFSPIFSVPKLSSAVCLLRFFFSSVFCSLGNLSIVVVRAADDPRGRRRERERTCTSRMLTWE